MPILDFGFWNSGLNDVETVSDFGFWISEFGIWNLEFGIWNLEFGIWNSGLSDVETGLIAQYAIVIEKHRMVMA